MSTSSARREDIGVDRTPPVDTLDGFTVGDIVWQQMYSPQDPAWTSTIEERIEHGSTYGPRRMMRLAGIVPGYKGSGRTRWHLVDIDRPNDEHLMSWVENNWCVLEHANTEVAMLW